VANWCQNNICKHYRDMFWKCAEFTGFSLRPIILVHAGHMKDAEALELLVQDNAPDYQGIRDYSECMHECASSIIFSRIRTSDPAQINE